MDQLKKKVLAASIVVVAVATLGGAAKSKGDWTCFGGPNQQFHAESGKLTESWPEDGPQKLWQRNLGEGYSAILAEADRLYTMHRADEREAVLALDAATGKTLWEQSYDAKPAENHVAFFGNGPRSTPLISGDSIFAIGVSGKMHALKKSDGAVLWTHDLWAAPFHGSVLEHGYASSPIDFKDNVIVLVGGDTHAIVALDKETGEVAWKAGGFKNSYSTPTIVRVEGKDVLLAFMADQLVALDPASGKVHFTFAHVNPFEQNINMPVIAEGNMLFISSPVAGSKGLKLKPAADGFDVEEVWATRKIQFYHVTSVKNGDWVYGSTGTQAPAFMASVNIKTGDIAWRKRGFAKANCLAADGKLFILDEDGQLTMAKASPEDLQVLAQFKLFDDVSWTVPTIVGTTMYARDKANLVALKLG